MSNFFSDSELKNLGVRNYIASNGGELGASGWFPYNSTVTASSVSSNTIFATPQPLSNGQQVYYSFAAGGAVIGGLTNDTYYYVVNATTTSGITQGSFQLATSINGTPIVLTSSGTGNQYFAPTSPVLDAVAVASPPSGSYFLLGLSPANHVNNSISGSNSLLFYAIAPTLPIAGQGSFYNFTIEPVDLAKVLEISFDYCPQENQFTASSGQTGSLSDIMVFIEDVTNNILIPVTPNVLTSQNNTANLLSTKFTGTFQTSYNSSNYRLFLHGATGNGASSPGVAVVFDNISVRPQSIPVGTPVTDWQAYNPVITATTTAPTLPTSGNYTQNAQWRRVGDTLELQYELNITSTAGAAAGSGTYLWSLPPGLSADTSKIFIAPSGSQTVVGSSRAADTAVNNFDGKAILYSSTQIALYGKFSPTGTTSNLISDSPIDSGSFEFTDPNVPLNYSFTARIPILGWSSQVQMSNGSDTRVVASRAVMTSNENISNLTNTTVVFNSSVFDTHGAYNAGTGVYTVPVSGYYSIYSHVLWVNAGVPNTIMVFVNGSVFDENQQVSSASSATSQITSLLKLNAGDQVAILVYQNSGSTQTLNSVFPYNAFSINKLSGSPTIAANDTVACIYSLNSTASIPANSPILFTNKIIDTTGSFNTSNSIYTAPISGIYKIEIGGIFGNGSSDISLLKNGTSIFYLGTILSTSRNSNTATINLIAGDTIQAVLIQTNTPADNRGNISITKLN